MLAKIMPNPYCAFLQCFTANFKRVCSKITENCKKYNTWRLKFTVKLCKNTAQGVDIILTSILCYNFAFNFF